MGNSLSCCSAGAAEDTERQDARPSGLAAADHNSDPKHAQPQSQAIKPKEDAATAGGSKYDDWAVACCMHDDGDPDKAPIHSVEPTGAPWDLRAVAVPSPPNEEERRNTGMALGLYTAPHCHELDVILSIVSRIFDAPYTSVALYYNRSCWLTSTYGMGSGVMPWKLAACPWNTLKTQPQTIVCGELMEDARFAHQPWVATGLRCYVSAPLLASNGHRLGTVCFMDSVPRKVDAGMCRVLNNFGEVVVRTLERHLRLASRLNSARQQVPAALNGLVQAANTGRDVRGDSGIRNAISGGLPGVDEGHWGEEDEEQDTLTESNSTLNASQPNNLVKSINDPPSQPDNAVVPNVSRALRAPSTTSSSRAAKPLPADALLSSAFARQLRNVEAVQDACCLVVDTGVAGWPVLYADDTWKLWAGFSRNDLLGQKLQTLLAPATPGVAPLNWGALQQEVDKGERFVVPGVVAFPPAAPAPAPAKASSQSKSAADLSRKLKRQCSQPMLNTSWQPTLDQEIATKKRSLASSTSFRTPSEMRSARIKAPSTDALATLSPRRIKHTTPPALPSEDLLQAVVLHEADQRYMLGGGPGVMNSGEELWHEAAGIAQAFSMASSSSMQSAMHGTAGKPTQPTGPRTAGLSSLSTTSLSTQGRIFDLSFRPMALDVLDDDALPLGIPSWVPLEACAPMLKLYAVRLHPVTTAPLPVQPLAPSLKVTCRLSSSLAQLACHLFPGISMGQVLGRGGYGTAYTGNWHEMAVVVKVQDHMLDGPESLRTAQMEVALGQMLRHPYLVRTLAHGAAEVAPTPAGTPDPGSLTATQTGSGMPMHSGFGRLSRWLVEAEESWDDFGETSWFSHCSKADMVKRDPVAPQTAQAIADQLPVAANFVNAVAIASDMEPMATPFGPPSGLTNAPTAEPADADKPGPEPVQRQRTLVLNLADSELAPPVAGLGSLLVAHGPQAQQVQQVEINYKPLAEVPEVVSTPAHSNQSGAAGNTLVNPALAKVIASDPFTRTSLDRLSNAPSSILAPQRSSMSVTAEMATMMEMAQEHASRVGAKPMQYPMHLRTFAILEYCDGGTLQDAVDRGWLRKGSCHVDNPPDLLKIITLGSHIACAAAYLHDRGVVHADLSAANVLLCSSRATVAKGSDANPTTGLTSDDNTTPSKLAEVPASAITGLGGSKAANSKASTQQTSNGSSVNDGARLTVEDVADRLYTLPTKRYSLAPPKARTADEMHFVAKVSDFGKSCLLGPEGVIKAGGYATVTHMAPEVLQDYLLSPAADVYALGVLMWQMYTGCRPWAGLNHQQILGTVASKAIELEWPEKVVASLPPVQQEVAGRFRDLGRSCLAYDAPNRPDMVTVERELLAMAQQLEAGGA